MKKIFWLFKKEIKTLYKFIVLITIIITLFLSALFGVTNILIDYSKNFKTTLNEDLNGLEFEVANSNYSSLQTYCENAVVRAKLKNYTHTTKLECSNGNYFDTDQFEQKEEVTYLKSYNGVVLYSYEHFANKLKEQNINLEGSWHKGKNQIVLSDIVAEQLQAKIGDSIKILEYTEGGRIKTIKIGNLNLSGVEVRTLLGLKSANFEVNIEGDNIKFSVKGYGHGVGMSQTGADSMAKAGSNYEQIVKHFYTDVEIVDM